MIGALAYLLVVVAVVVWVIVTTLYGYFRSVGSSLAILVRGGGEKGMAAMERALAVAEIGALALLADGEVTEREREALADALRTARLGVSVDEALARGRATAPGATDPTVLRDAVTRAAQRLGPEQREQAFDLVVRLAQAGATLGATVEGYRAVRRADPEALVALFGDALQIAPQARPAVTRSA